MDNSSSTLNETVTVLDVLDSPLWVHVLSATWLLLIFVLGTLENGVILYVFARNRQFVTTNNIPVIAMLLNCLCQSVVSTPLPFIAEISGGWDARLSDTWCTFEAFIVYQFGLTSLYLLLQITLLRYVTITRPIESTQMTNVHALIGVLISYSVAAIFSVCPLFGFGSYGLETHKTSCGLAWNDQSLAGRAYIIVIFVFCFLLPVALMAMSYTAIFKVVNINLFFVFPLLCLTHGQKEHNCISKILHLAFRQSLVRVRVIRPRDSQDLMRPYLE